MEVLCCGVFVFEEVFGGFFSWGVWGCGGCVCCGRRGCKGGVIVVVEGYFVCFLWDLLVKYLLWLRYCLNLEKFLFEVVSFVVCGWWMVDF